MSASLEVHGVIDDWPGVKAYLFGEVESSAAAVRDENDWGWKDDEEDDPTLATAISSPRDRKIEENWPQDCVVASSPMADLFVVARGQQAVFLTSVWNSRTNKMLYSKSFQGKISEEEEKVTSALCVPLISKKKSSPGAPDWTCVIIGFSNGYIRMYTENGSLLFSQMFHDECVTSIKCRSFQSASNSKDHDQLEELFVLYKKVIVTVDGFGLFQMLRGCRNHLARKQANATESLLDAPPLSFKKWKYESKGVSDCESGGVQTPSSFDHLLTASIIGGVNARPNKSPYTSNIFETVGDTPYLAFHYAQEGQAVPMINELAYAVASKLKSSLLNAAGGWLGFGGAGSAKQIENNSKPEKPVIEPATPMAARFGLPDQQRSGRSIILSPCRKLSAITDTLGRVTLIDNDRGIAVRMWKGYRDAHCAWLQVDDDMNSKTRASERKALFLIIYAPRRGQLEVFSMQQGPKIASFSVSKGGRLLGLFHGMMGLNNIPIKGGNKPLIQCLFLDTEAQLYTLNIPFHLALCDDNNSKQKDLHLLKSLQRLLRGTEYSESDVTEVLFDIKTQGMVNQAFKMLTQSCRKANVFSKVVELYLEKYCDDDDKDLAIIFRIQSLLHLYSYLLNSAQMPPPYSETTEGAGSSSHDNTVLLCMHTTEKEITLIKDIANKELFNSSSAKTVSFKDDEEFLSVNEFFASLSIEFDPSKVKLNTSLTDNKLRLNLQSDSLSKFGKILLCGCLNNNSDLNEWKSFVKNCDLLPCELLQETLKFWCKNALISSSFVDMMERLYHVVRTLCELEGSKVVMNGISGVSIWWDNIRRELAANSQIFCVYTFSVVCRAVSIDLQQDIELENRKLEGKTSTKTPLKSNQSRAQGAEGFLEEDDKMDCDINEMNDESEEGWENVSLDLIKWNILLKQIEDLSLLSTILAQRPQITSPALPVLPAATEDLYVTGLLDKGQGCIAELVGRWLTSIGIDPVLLVDPSELTDRDSSHTAEYTKKELEKHKVNKKDSTVTKEEQMDVDQKALEESADADSEISYVLELLRCLKENFTISLNSSIILSNYCWECCLEWNKNVDVIEYLNAAVSCVACVPSNSIREGLMSMMWSTFISKQLANLISKGKAGKEKFIERKLSGITSQEDKERFFRVCIKFLDEFMETNVLCEGVQRPMTSTSKKTHWSTEASSMSLTELALLQAHTNYEMILLHYQLAVAELFIHALNIKKPSMRPMNLFDTKARMMFFSNMSSPAPYSNVEVDLALKVHRVDFLCLVVSHGVYAISEELDSTVEEDESESNDTKYIVPSQEGVKDCEYWVQKCFELGRIWGSDLDAIRINQVCELYSCGFDLLGLEVLLKFILFVSGCKPKTIGSVSARDVLGSKLLVIAGMRLQYIIQTSEDGTTEILSALSTNLSNWLNKLNYSDLRCVRFPKTSITDLAQQLIQLIPESNYDYRLADELLMCSSFLS